MATIKWGLDHLNQCIASVENSSNRLIFRKKQAIKEHFFSKKIGQLTGEIIIFLDKKRGLSSFAFPFFLALFTVLQVHPKTRLSITWP